MAMTVVVTRDAPDRFRGFLASVMLEIAPGVYTAPRMSKAVRERVWSVLEAWWVGLPGGSVVITWNDPAERSGQAVRTLGLPAVQLHEEDGLFLACRTLKSE
ncbi:MAG: type I-E CRISPR-associated endoribonuclease Cas2e [Pseudomonadota bacterium]|nr:type I-E CRISPR-associated endoribonuclease Cas2e [Pseudomonadota bacterium]